MAFYAYVLRSVSTGRFYIGHSGNLAQRLADHNRHHTVSIKNRGPWQLIYTEEFATRAEASNRERQMKRMKSHRWLEQVARASR